MLCSACDRNKLTSWLWRAAAEQLEVEVISAKTLALQVFQELGQSGPKCVCAVQAEALRGLFDLEVLVLTNRPRFPQINLNRERQSLNSTET